MPTSELAAATGTVRINEHSIVLPEDQARTLFLAAVALTRRTGPLAISPDTTVAVNQSTQLSLSISGGFEDEFDPQGVLDRALSKRSAVGT
jgi:hypothetical protein